MFKCKCPLLSPFSLSTEPCPRSLMLLLTPGKDSNLNQPAVHLLSFWKDIAVTTVGVAMKSWPLNSVALTLEPNHLLLCPFVSVFHPLEPHPAISPTHTHSHILTCTLTHTLAHTQSHPHTTKGSNEAPILLPLSHKLWNPLAPPPKY